MAETKGKEELRQNNRIAEQKENKENKKKEKKRKKSLVKAKRGRERESECGEGRV